MLFWTKGNGIENIFSLDVYSVYGSTINAKNSDTDTVQYLPKSTMFVQTPTSFYINIVSQLTQEVKFVLLGTFGADAPVRSKQFKIYIDEAVQDNHVNLDNGLFDYSVVWGTKTATSIDSTEILAELTNGIVLVQDENWLNKEFENSPSGLEPIIIPNSISYNG